MAKVKKKQCLANLTHLAMFNYLYNMQKNINDVK